MSSDSINSNVCFVLRNFSSFSCLSIVENLDIFEISFSDSSVNSQPRSQGLFPGLGAGREKTLASAGHVSALHPEILGVIN